MLIIPGADAAIVGIVARCGQDTFVVYSREKLVAHFVAGGMTFEEADEWVSYNVEGAWVGDGTPGVLQEMAGEDVVALYGEDVA